MINEGLDFNGVAPVLQRASLLGTRSAGFTLLEIAISIFILAGSMVAILSLQSASLERAIRDRDKQQAMLLARSVLAEIELGLQSTSPGEQRFNASEFLTKYSEALGSKEFGSVDLERMQVALLVSNWEYPIPTGSATQNNLKLKRVDLTVSWGDTRREQISLVLFLSDEEDPYSESSGGFQDGAD